MLTRFMGNGFFQERDHDLLSANRIAASVECEHNRSIGEPDGRARLAA